MVKKSCRSIRLIEKKYYLSLGSNIGNRKQNLLKACIFLKSFLSDINLSQIYETKPMYLTNQAKFLNMVVSGKTILDCFAVLDKTQAVEMEMGRKRSGEISKGPRIIDIDILLCGSAVIKSRRLSIPHPRLEERQFVLVPLLEISPDIKDPRTGILYAELQRGLPDQGVYTISGSNYNENSIEAEDNG
jgi:2-amino-4-hydroxy-6-hydroxymethyldihydropteridine diphosphokinase